ncbi:MAG: hypothetical protein N2C12_19095, partial [Planctomycetales bacterium]
MKLSQHLLAIRFLWLATLLAIAPSATAAENSFEHWRMCRYCSQNFRGDPPPAANGRNYPPDRPIDMLHLKLDVTPDFASRKVAGTCTLTFKPIARPLETLTLNAVDLDVGAVRSEVGIESFYMSDKGLEIAFKNPIEPGTQVEIAVDYEVEPKKGLYFRTPQQRYPNTDTQIWTQGEPHEGRHWFPSFDYPNEHFTSEVICHVPADMTVLSNGRLVEEKLSADNETKAVHWRQEKPHVNYLIALVAGYFDKLEGKYRDIPLGFYTPPSRSAYAKNAFRDTPDILQFFEEYTGVDYPWAKYD